MNHNGAVYNIWMESFKWDSEEQRKGVLALAQWMIQHGRPPIVNPSDAFYARIIHEAHEHAVEVVGSQIKDLQNHIRGLQSEITALRVSIEEIRQGKVPHVGDEP